MLTDILRVLGNKCIMGRLGVNNVNVIWTIRRGYFVRIYIEITLTLCEKSCKQNIIGVCVIRNIFLFFLL